MDTKIWDSESDRYTASAIEAKNHKHDEEKHELGDICGLKAGAIGK